jgi:two-component system chemotaxis sensor kinase CheA
VWAQEILAPLLRQAGHEVVFGMPEKAAMRPGDVVLSTAGEPVRQRGRRGDPPVIRLRNSPRGAGSSDPSIYRYDRDGLMRAIEAARREEAA